MTTEAILRTQVIERAWIDPEFKAKLMTNPKAAIKEALGITLPEQFKLRAVEEQTDELCLVIPPNPAAVLKSEVKPQYIWN